MIYIFVALNVFLIVRAWGALSEIRKRNSRLADELDKYLKGT